MNTLPDKNDLCKRDSRFLHPFGETLQLAELSEKLDAASGWEAKNRMLVQLAKQLPDWPAHDKTTANKVVGCESQVWLTLENSSSGWLIAADSDSKIVKGLLALVLTAYYGRSSDEIVAFDFEAWLNERGMQRFLSASRGNGLRAMVNTIRQQSAPNKPKGISQQAID